MNSNVVGNYQIQAKIGEGGMGAVFLGLDLMLEREVAIKVLRPELACQPQVVERFRAEAVTLARLNHSHIATLYNFLRHGDDFLMVMEFVRGETLESVIKRCGALPLGQSLRLFCQALEGISEAHALGIVHRDLKPSNLMLTEKGAIKVMDFGIARVLGSARMTRTGRILGTIEYMSPEQVHGQETDARSDIYSLGIVLYEMLTGHVPFSSNSEFELMRAQIEDPPPPPRNFAAHIPPAVEAIVLRALAKNPAERFQTSDEFRAALLNTARTLNLSLNTSASDAKAILAAPSASDGRDASDALPETRLAGGAIYSFGAASASDQFIKETRLGRMSGSAPVVPATLPLPLMLRQMAERLTWKHYGAGAAALVMLIVAFTLLGSRKTSPTNAPIVSVPANTPVSSAAPVLPQTVNPQPTIEPLEDAGVKPLSGVITSNEAPRTTRAKSPVRRSENNPPPPPAPTPSSVVAARPTPPPVQHTRAPEPADNQHSEERKEERKKDKGSKWERIFGGAIEVMSGIKDVKEHDKQKDKERKKN
jgi:serine/threonine-protein kinase